MSILFGSLTPERVDIVAGESVDWANTSIRTHTVTADDGSYDSGSMSANEHYERVFADPGTFAYHCRFHPYINGEVDVHELLLDAPAAPASPNAAYPLSGRTALPAGSPVSLQFDDGSGSGWRAVGDTSVGTDGHFNLDITPSASGSYRAVSGDQTSPSVDLLVLNRSITAQARAVRHGIRITAVVTPASPRQTVVLQERLRERFGWWPVAQHKLGKDSRTTFTVAAARHVPIRVVLTLPDGATALATSRTLHAK